MRAEEFNLPKEKFVLVNENKKLHDKELVTKPVGYFRDAFNRFCKNKGSITGAIVIGILVLYSIVAPIFSPYTVSYRDSYYRFTLPKLFTQIDFLDGCSEKTLNETSFLRYYSMGVETGHNAIKNQEYTVSEVVNYDGTTSKMYTFRLDSYQMNGNVFKNVTRAEYNAIQEYQDEHNVQIIYPITDSALRPVATQDNNDANFWMSNEPDGSKTKLNNYTINADGSIEFEPIYAQYNPGRLKSITSFNGAAKIKLVSKDEGKFAIQLLSSNKYLTIECAGEYASAFLTEELNEAASFSYDTANKIIVTEITGFDDPSYDGEYFFGIGETGSSLNVIKVSVENFANYNAFTVFSNETTVVNEPQIGVEYYLASSRKIENYSSNYLGAYDSVNKTFPNKTVSNAATLSFEDNGTGGYALGFKSGKFKNYLKVTTNGNDNKIETVTNKNDGSTFYVNDSTGTSVSVYTTINGHTSAANDGNYTFVCSYDGTNFAISFKQESKISGSDLYMSLYKNDGTIVTSFDASLNYVLGCLVDKSTTKYYYVNGAFDGDNYFSKMRFEGEDEYKYAYARPTAGDTFEIRINYYEYYCYYHQAVLHDKITQPFFLFGTTNNGQDIFTCLASGARFSFIMAIVVASVNLFVGAIYGAIEGYYGGKIDLIMERIVEILSAVPFMIVITLLKYHMGGTSQWVILFISFFLTGWIGMSGTVRMQFYRFKNQEYVLAARTLGAKDKRIMFKHIFPNSLGTIVTSCVLVIPGMIFSETSLSYLGIINLNSGDLTSVGTLLAAGQPYLVNYPHMILYPSIFISLLMLCFNLFGNGLRDAFNPSLRGTED